MALIVFTFQQAWDIFNTPPAQALGIKPGEPLAPETTGVQLLWIVVRLLVLLVMAAMGSLVAKWGIRMYGIKFEWPLGKKEAPSEPSQGASRTSAP
jgi:hypothetical protein